MVRTGRAFVAEMCQRRFHRHGGEETTRQSLDYRSRGSELSITEPDKNRREEEESVLINLKR